MKKVLLILFLMGALWGEDARHDSGLWLVSFFNTTVSKKDRFVYYTQYRYRDQMKKLFFWAVEGIWYHHLTANWEVGPGYREGWDLNDGKVTSTHMPYFVALGTFEGDSGFILSRHRFEYRMRDGGPYRFVYRNLLEWDISLPHCKKYVPFISDEIFWRESAGIHQNRFMVGLQLNLTEKLTLSPIYLRLMDRGEGTVWFRTNILQITSVYDF